MKLEKNEIKFALILGIVNIFSILFLYLSNIKIADFLTIDIFQLIQKTISPFFFIFSILFSVSIAISYCASKRFEFKKAKIIILSTWFISSIIGLLIFGLLEFIGIYLVSLIGFYLLSKSSETDSVFSSGYKAAKTIVLFFSVGLFLSILFITFFNSAEFEKNFNSDLLKTTIGEETSFEENIKEPLIDSIILTQTQTINSIQNFQTYKILADKNDADVNNFIAQLNALKQAINEESYKQTIQNSSENLDFTTSLIDEMPILENVSKLAWLIYPLTAFILSISIFGVIIKVLTGIIYSILRKIINRNTNEKDIYSWTK